MNLEHLWYRRRFRIQGLQDLRSHPEVDRLNEEAKNPKGLISIKQHQFMVFLYFEYPHWPYDCQFWCQSLKVIFICQNLLISLFIFSFCNFFTREKYMLYFMKQKVLDIRCFKFLTSPLGLLTSGWDLKSKRPYIWPLFRRLGALMFFRLYIAHCCLCSESHSLLNWVCEGFKYMQFHNSAIKEIHTAP